MSKEKHPHSRWLKGAERYSAKRTVEHTRYVRQARGGHRKETDSPTEVKFVERLHTAPGWRNGARVRKS